MAAYTLEITDSVAGDETAAANGILSDVFAEGLGVSHTGSDGFVQMLLTAAEDITVDETPVANAVFQDILAEDVTADDTAVAGRLLFAVETEGFTADDTMTMNAIISEVISEGGAFGMVLSVNGAQFVVWSANADTFAHSSYDNYDFDSMCRLGSDYYGTREDGVYKLTGDNDAGAEISWFLSLPTTDMDTALFKRVPKAYLGFKSDGFVYLRTIIDDGTERLYMFKKTSPTLAGSGVTLGRGVKSRYWTFDLIAVDGSDIELDQIEFYPVVLGRRVP